MNSKILLVTVLVGHSISGGSGLAWTSTEGAPVELLKPTGPHRVGPSTGPPGLLVGRNRCGSLAEFGFVDTSGLRDSLLQLDPRSETPQAIMHG